MKNRENPAIDYRRDKIDIPGKVVRIIYRDDSPEPLALIQYVDGEKRYIIAPDGIQVGNIVKTGTTAELKPGNALPLRYIPEGMPIHNVELRPGEGGRFVRTAGAAAKIVSKNEEYCSVQLPSGKVRQIPVGCTATIGQIRDSKKKKSKLKEVYRDELMEKTVPAVELEDSIRCEEMTPTIKRNDAKLSCSFKSIEVFSGHPINFSIKATNAGESCWTSIDVFHLEWLYGYEDFPDVDSYLQLNLDEEEIIPPGDSKVWNIYDLLAPDEPGFYALVWQMAMNGNKYFGSRINIIIITKPHQATIEQPVVNPILSVKPPLGKPNSVFSISVTGLTPNSSVTIKHEACNDVGWQIINTTRKANNKGVALLNLKWKYSGTYDIWAIDEATGIETKSARVVVRP